ncbi:MULTISPECIES: NUDIX hydrolase [Paenibacillus]|uniref:NUDIX hydrolase n=1 Tax=Paenibacillus radicis (ex Xue et al. 2023) TaxID=2972489 RepID=A0ABT1YID8_9BACL|nr:NUDIX hydrolase [Paenibacillus radicis (ex Xue et al. 2023)]MCR8631740.1 NUDIX hydrolase [Paenibacillus radicis (ex Xue et al. 2023)]
MSVNFCSSCGHSMETRSMDGVERRACTNCTSVHWGNYSIGVGALVVKDNKVLLVRRAQEPGKGNWTNPGGYIEQLEPIEETIVREVLEEAGVHATVKGIVAVRDQPRAIHNVYIAFEMQYVSGEPIPDGYEVDEAGFFSLEEMKSMKVASFTQWLVDIALNGQSDGLLADREPIVPSPGNGFFRIP